MTKLKHIPFILVIALLPSSLYSQSFGFDGQVIGWTTVNPMDSLQLQGGLRYIPELNFSIPVGNLTLEGEGSLDLWGTATYTGADTLSLDESLEPYRVWMKLSGQQFEVRAGLQKINFGSANMIRPLMWFDQLDPRDPLQLSTGVYGILGRYYFLNNANIWVWGLYGNNERKGLEVFPSKKNSFEYGGRVQLPFPIGEVAATYHHRTSDPDAVLPEPLRIGDTAPENRYALDAKVDIGVGAWFEGALVQKQPDLLRMDNTTLLNAGMDYTFNIGNGLLVMFESLWYMQGEDPFGREQEVVFGGLSLNYPINIIHNLSAIVFVDFTNEGFYRFLNWSMTFDRWTFYTMAFWNPETYQLPGFGQEANLFSGAGFQLMAVFNH
jgi:hypothetical protein